MSDRTVVRLLRATVAMGGALAVFGTVMFFALGLARPFATGFFAFEALISAFFTVFVWLVAPQQPRNAVVWIMAAIAATAGLADAGHALAAWVVIDTPDLVTMVLGSGVVPADLPASAAWLVLLSDTPWITALFGWQTFGLLLFPEGRLPSPRWRWFAWYAGVSLLTLTVVAAWGYRPGSTAVALQGAVADIGSLFVLLAVILSLAALIVRFRRSTGAARQEIKWIVWGASIFIPALSFAFIVGGTQHQDLATIPVLVATAIFLFSYGIAVGKYQLFDIDVVLNKTVVGSLLAVVLAAIYVAVVVGVGALFGSVGGNELALQVAATALVAIAFGPARRLAQQWANRAVYGARVPPYEVLARFSHRAAEESDDELLTRIPRLIVDGTGAVAATLWVRSDGVFRAAASWPSTADQAEIAAADSFEDPAGDYSLPVFHDGELLGGLSLVKTGGEALPPAEEQLVANLASGMGLALRNAGLTAQLRDQVERLQASRERILNAADEARRALERDLDSGPQQQLVALKVMLGPTRKQAAQAGAIKTAAILEQLEADAGEAIRAVRDFSGGVYPPLLEAEGLAVAIAQQTRRAALPITVQADGLDRYSREIEAAVYFTILEALQNTAKYARASAVSVIMDETDGELTFEVIDDGAGFDPATVTTRSGLANMADRLDAVGGTWSLQSSPGSGTTVRGAVPVGD